MTLVFVLALLVLVLASTIDGASQRKKLRDAQASVALWKSSYDSTDKHRTEAWQSYSNLRKAVQDLGLNIIERSELPQYTLTLPVDGGGLVLDTITLTSLLKDTSAAVAVKVPKKAKRDDVLIKAGRRKAVANR
jgi:hypothetical protein